MKHSGLQRARQSTRKKMKKSLGPDFVDPSNLGLHGKETSSDVRCDICHEGLPINSKKDCITCKKCAIRAHANCVRTQLNVKYIKSHWLCVNCRHCYECDKSGVEQSELVFCRSCDRSYHYDCTEEKGVHNNGKYVCYRCAKPSVVNTRLSTTTPRQNSSTPATSSSASSTSTTTSTTTTSVSVSASASASASVAPNSNSRVAPRSVNKSLPPEGKSSNTTSHPSTPSNSSTPTPSTSRSSFQVKMEMIMEKRRPRSQSNTPSDRQVRSDHPERPPLQTRSERPVRTERASSQDPITQKRKERMSDKLMLPRTPGCNGIVRIRMDGSGGPVMSRPGPHYTLADLHQKQRDRFLKLMETQLAERPKLVRQMIADSRSNIDLPDVDMKDSFTDKPLTREHNEKLTEKPNPIKKVEPERENINKPKELSEKVEKQSTNENRRTSNEPSSENSRNPMNVNKTNGTGVRGTSLLALHGLTSGNENDIKSPNSIPQKLNLPEKRKANEIQGSGFVLSKPTELTEETAKLLKDSNGAKKLKLVLFERACKAESLLPAETSIWTTEDVYNFIRFIGFPDAADNFLDHQIDGKSLLLLSRRDVLTGFKLKLGPALKIYAHIFRLQRKRPALLLED